jgi:hypothetical protein
MCCVLCWRLSLVQAVAVTMLSSCRGAHACAALHAGVGRLCMLVACFSARMLLVHMQ